MKLYIKKYILFGGIALFCFTYGLFAQSLYRMSFKHLLVESVRTFQETIDKDRDFRLRQTPLSFISMPHDADTLTQISIERDGHLTQYRENTDSIRNLPPSVKQNHVIQSVLSYETPIIITDFDRLFHEGLRDKNIRAKTASIYTDNRSDSVSYSHPDSAFYTRAFALPPAVLGFMGEMTVQGFVKLSPFSVIRNSILPIGGTTMLWVLGMGVLLYFYFRKEKSVSPATDEAGIKPVIQWDTSRKLLTCQGKEIELSVLECKLLDFLLTKEDYYAEYEELAFVLYGNITNGKQRLAKTVSRLRKKMEDIPAIDLVNFSGKGYQITAQNMICYFPICEMA